jgi:hypothetical protein
MGKAPAFQFYPGDWRRDTQVQMASFETRGIWFEMLCCMWDAPERGKLSGTHEGIARLIGCDTDLLKKVIKELDDLKIADISNGNGNVTITNRRMHRDQKKRDNTRLRVKEHREREDCNANVTPPSSSSTSFSMNNKDTNVSLSSPETPGDQISKPPPCPHKEIIEKYHEILQGLPEVREWGGTAETYLRTRWKEKQERQCIEWWDAFFRFIRESDWLMGRVKSWSADLEWIVRPNNFRKILNGRYHQDTQTKKISAEALRTMRNLNLEGYL